MLGFSRLLTPTKTGRSPLRRCSSFSEVVRLRTKQIRSRPPPGSDCCHLHATISPRWLQKVAFAAEEGRHGSRLVPRGSGVRQLQLRLVLPVPVRITAHARRL